MTDASSDRLRDVLGEARVQRDAPLAPVTTFKVGGRADWLVHARTRRGDPSRARDRARARVARDRARRRLERAHRRPRASRSRDSRPWRRRHADRRRHRIRADGGVTINGLVRWTISHGVAGLEAWAGTPGTVGGAIHGNAHFRGRLISELIDSVTLAHARRERRRRSSRRDGVRLRLQPAAPDARGRDLRRLPRDRTAKPDVLRATARESLAFRKRTQPLESASAGCIFQNPDPRTRPRAGRHPVVGRRARRSGRSQGCARRPGTRLDDARELHRQRRRRQREGDQGSGRAVQTRRAFAVRRHACARKSCIWASTSDESGEPTWPHSGLRAGDGWRAASRSRATRTRRCRCWRRVCLTDRSAC